MDVRTIFRFDRCIDTLGVADNLEVVLNVIDGDLVLSGVILSHTGKERVSEMETRDPEDWWGTVINPVLILIESLHQVDSEGRKRLEGVVRPFLPGRRHNVIVETIGYSSQLLTHDYLSLNGLLQVDQRSSDGNN